MVASVSGAAPMYAQRLYKCLSAPRLQRAVRTKASNAQFMVGGNWKCNGSVESVQSLVTALNAGSIPAGTQVVCAPTFLHLPIVKESLHSRFELAAQNCWTGSGGAFTGEVAADMIKDFGVGWVITGHSERRALCGETNEVVGEKTAYALSKGLKVIACIGESLEMREAGKLWEVLGDQMAALKASIPMAKWSQVVIAYEPVWAIGTGVVATPEQAQEVHAWLRKWVANELSPDVANYLRILYGGSVKAANCAELAAQEDIDGFLVGGASLDGKEFVTICNAQASVASAA